MLLCRTGIFWKQWNVSCAESNTFILLSICRMPKGKVGLPADSGLNLFSLININQLPSLHKPFVKLIEKMTFFSINHYCIHDPGPASLPASAPLLCLDPVNLVNCTILPDKRNRHHDSIRVEFCGYFHIYLHILHHSASPPIEISYRMHCVGTLCIQI